MTSSTSPDDAAPPARARAPLLKRADQPITATGMRRAALELGEAVAQGDRRTVRRLLTAGARPVGRARAAVLCRAIQHEHEEILNDLLQAGVDPNAAHANGTTALMWAAERCAADGRMVRCLVAAGVDVNARDQRGRTALMAAMNDPCAPAARALLEAGADVNAATVHGHTALMLATQTHAELVRLVLAAGADVNRVDSIGETVLHWAARFGDADIVRMLLEAGAEATTPNRGGKTPLECCAEAEAAHVLQAFLDRAALQRSVAETPSQAPGLSAAYGRRM